MSTPNTVRAKKIHLPRLVLTETCEATDPEAIQVKIGGSPITSGDTYYVRPKQVARSGGRRDGKPIWGGQRINLFPLVMDSHGIPWAEANIYILSRLQNAVAPKMSTYSSISADLVAYRQFLDEEPEIDWLHFPSQKLNRPTYRYNGSLRFSVSSDEISAKTANRRMGTVIAFYRWLKQEGVLNIENPAWEESDRYIKFKNDLGFNLTKKVVTTDISIKIPKNKDPYDGMIDDGGKLRPLPTEEQEWLIDALLSSGNTEMTLIHLFGLLTGARIQTILTFRVCHVNKALADENQSEVRVPVGPGTKIDTKFGKQAVLRIPSWFYQMLYTYAHSNRAKKRRLAASGGDTDNQYLFLSMKSAPLYSSGEDVLSYNDANELRHVKNGQGVRQFIKEETIPFIRKKYGVKDFHYKFHDTRATYGMNLTDTQLKLVAEGKITLFEAREFIKSCMWHESSATTDKYLQFRKNLAQVRAVESEHEDHLKSLTQRAMDGVL